MNKAGLRFLPGTTSKHNQQASERVSQWDSEINEYYDSSNDDKPMKNNNK